MNTIAKAIAQNLDIAVGAPAVLLGALVLEGQTGWLVLLALILCAAVVAARRRGVSLRQVAREIQDERRSLKAQQELESAAQNALNCLTYVVAELNDGKALALVRQQYDHNRLKAGFLLGTTPVERFDATRIRTGLSAALQMSLADVRVHEDGGLLVVDVLATRPDEGIRAVQ